MTRGARNLYINLGLLAAVLALAAILWMAPPRDVQGLKPFAHIDASALQQIEIFVPQRPAARLQNRDGVWRAQEPAAAELDPQRLDNLLGILHASVDTGYSAASLDLGEFGLESPAAVLKLDAHSIVFGATEPLSRRRYVLYDGTIYLLTDMHYPLLSRGIDNLLVDSGGRTP